MSGREWPAQITMERKFPGPPRPIYATGIHMDSEYERYVPSQPVQGLVEALGWAVNFIEERIPDGFDPVSEPYDWNEHFEARKALADFKAKNNTEEACR